MVLLSREARRLPSRSHSRPAARAVEVSWRPYSFRTGRTISDRSRTPWRSATPTNLSQGLDGGVLEIKIGGGSYTDIVAAGGSFVSGGYNATLISTNGN